MPKKPLGQRHDQNQKNPFPFIPRLFPLKMQNLFYGQLFLVRKNETPKKKNN